MSKAEQLIDCLEGEIAKRGEELAACRVSVENCEVFRARIAELEFELEVAKTDELSAAVWAATETIKHDLWDAQAELAAIKAQEPIAWYTEDHLDDKSATTYSWTVAERWVEKGWPVSPLYAAPVSEAKAQGVVMPEGWIPLTIEHEPGYPEDVAFGPKRMMDRLKRWLDRYFEMRLAATPVQQVSVPDGWRDGYRAAMNSAASGARQLYVQHCHHHGVNGLLDRCKELEQSFIRDADALLTAAPAAPAADATVRQATDGGRNQSYEGLFDGETEEQRASRLAAHSAKGVV